MISFKQFLEEAKKKPKEDNWHSGPEAYASGYSNLRDIQANLNVEMDGRKKFQLFVPKRRDPQVEIDRARDRRYREAKREVDAELKEEKAPVLTGFNEAPPGDNKPGRSFWTSTAIDRNDGTYTSDWYLYVKNNHRGWQTDYGYLFEVQPDARVFNISYAEQYYQWAMDQKRMKLPEREYYRPYSRDDMRSRFPWDELSRHFDAVHCSHPDRGHGYGDDFTYGWDVESTAWFNTAALKYKGAVKLFRGGDPDDE